jgi:hypothetical protein
MLLAVELTLLLSLCASFGATASADECDEHQLRCGNCGTDRYVDARKDENARLKWTCPQDSYPHLGMPSCMPRKYVEEDWTCISRYGVSSKCADVGDPPCIDGKELEEAEANPCIASKYPRQFNYEQKKPECVERTVKELREEVDELKEELKFLQKFVGCAVVAVAGESGVSPKNLAKCHLFWNQ